MNIRRLLGILAVLALAISVSGIHLPGEPPYTEAEFSYSTDPTRAILHVTRVSAMLMGYSRSLTLFGDGKLKLVKEEKGEKSHFTRSLSQTEVDALMRNLVDHGLAEWDQMALYALEIERTGRGFPPPSDASKVQILIRLEEYSRGDLVLTDLTRRIVPRGAESSYARALPDVPEYKGIVYLNDFFRSQLELAEKESAR